MILFANTLNNITVHENSITVVFSNDLSARQVHQFILKSKSSRRYVFDFRPCRLSSVRLTEISKKRYPFFKSIRLSQYRKRTTRLVVELTGNYRLKYHRISNKIYIKIFRVPLRNRAQKSGKKSSIKGLFAAIGNIISMPTGSGQNQQKISTERGTQKRKISTSNKSSQESTGMKSSSGALKRRYRVIIDPGHGGRDSGATGGSRKYLEKRVVLQIALKVRRYLQSMGFEVYMTRSSDRYVKLRRRTIFANKKRGDVFVSIHANAVSRRSRKFSKAYGIETYFLQVTRNERAKRVAAMENSVVLDKKDRLSKNVILNSVLTGPKIVLSNKLAIDVQQGMLSKLRKRYRNIKDGGVRPAPFWVLVGAEMPAILVEVGYISNRWEKKRLLDPGYQDTLARGIAEGIARYLANREREFE